MLCGCEDNRTSVRLQGLLSTLLDICLQLCRIISLSMYGKMVYFLIFFNPCKLFCKRYCSLIRSNLTLSCPQLRANMLIFFPVYGYIRNESVRFMDYLVQISNLQGESRLTSSSKPSVAAILGRSASQYLRFLVTRVVSVTFASAVSAPKSHLCQGPPNDLTSWACGRS